MTRTLFIFAGLGPLIAGLLVVAWKSLSGGSVPLGYGAINAETVAITAVLLAIYGVLGAIPAALTGFLAHATRGWTKLRQALAVSLCGSVLAGVFALIAVPPAIEASALTRALVFMGVGLTASLVCWSLARSEAIKDIGSIQRLPFVFGLLGPPLGGVTLFVITTIQMVLEGKAGGPFWAGFVTLPFILILSYPFGLLPAVVAGVLVGAFVPRRSLPVEVLSVTAIGLIVGLAYGSFWTYGRPDAFSANTIFAITSLVPTLACWLIARRSGMVRSVEAV